MSRTPRRRVSCLIASALALTLAACVVKPKPQPATGIEVVLHEIPESEWPLLLDDLDSDSFAQACDQSLSYFARLPQDRSFRFGNQSYTAAQLSSSLALLRQVVTSVTDPALRRSLLARDFVLHQAVGRDGQGTVLFTGYYEPVLEARKKPGAPFLHPVYAVPDDLVTIDLTAFGDQLPERRLVGRVTQNRVIPYPDREAIDFAGAIRDKAQVLGYLADPVEVFFLHIQGSGQLRFADGERIRVGYAASNGHPYRSIGKLLLDEGLMTYDEMSMQKIKAFLAANPEQRRRVLAYNPSYVFFRSLPADGGPLGCYELPLTDRRSIATDRGLFPAPVAAWVSGSIPAPEGGDQSFARFVLNQDTGGAIKGPGRVDLFFGSGPEAGELAGRTKHLGRLFFFLPRPVAAPSSG